MRIAIDIRNIGKKRTGDEAVFFNLVKELAKIDAENEYFLCIDTRSEENLSEVRSRLGIEDSKNFHLYPLGSGNKFLWNGWTVPQFVRRMNIDIFHTQYIVPLFLPKRVKLVTHIHDVSFRAYPKMISWKDRFFFALLIPYALHRANVVVVVSQFTREEIGKWYGMKFLQKIRVVQNGIAFHRGSSQVSAERQLAIREKYHLPEKFFFYVGTLQPRKNIPFLLQAFDKFALNVTGVSLVIAGNRSGHNVDKGIEVTIRGMKCSERVIFPGYIEEQDLSDLYRMSECFVFPSKYEGFGLPIGEAIDLGVPTLVSDIPSHREVAGENVRYFSPDVLDELVKLLYTVHTENRGLFVEKSPHILLPRWDTSARVLREVYGSLF
jgi:glycosyltransferase involved in cell wall biosynthesis